MPLKNDETRSRDNTSLGYTSSWVTRVDAKCRAVVPGFVVYAKTGIKLAHQDLYLSEFTSNFMWR